MERVKVIAIISVTCRVGVATIKGFYANGKSHVDPTSQSLFLRYRYISSLYTILEGVQNLAPGTMLTCEGRDFEMENKIQVVLVIENMSFPRDRRVRQEALALASAGLGVSVICPRGNKQDTS